MSDKDDEQRRAAEMEQLARFKEAPAEALRAARKAAAQRPTYHQRFKRPHSGATGLHQPFHVKGKKR